jgi:hypothetical protein
MLKRLLNRLFAQPQPDMVLDRNDAWQHPALQRMTQRELADLPFPRGTDIESVQDPGAVCRGPARKDDGKP